MRWEWRTFGDEFGAAEDRLGSLPVKQVTDSDETYLLASEDGSAVKIRDGLMDIKLLEDVDGDGLELWKPIMKSPLPVSAADAGRVLAALGVSVQTLDRHAYGLADLADASSEVATVAVHKKRRHVHIGDCLAELTDLRVGDRTTRTIAIESERAADVIAAVRELELESRPNVSMPRILKALR